MSLEHDIRKILVSANIRCTGEFRAIVHTGHEYNEAGDIVKYGDVITETPFKRNTITNVGFNEFLGGNWRMWMVAGSGSTAPTESDNTLDSYLGRATSRSGLSRSIQNDPGAGDLYWRITLRCTFNPGSLGSGSVNVAEAGIVSTGGDGISGIDASTPVGARGLLVDNMGNPTTVSLDATTEYLDIEWRYTEYFPYDDVNVVSLDIHGTPTNHDLVVRPNRFNTSGGDGWDIPGSFNGSLTSAVRFPIISTDIGSGNNMNQGTAMTAGALDVPSNYPTSTYSGNKRPQTMTLQAYTTDSKQRLCDITWTLLQGNAPAPGSNIFIFALGHTFWQCEIDPPIAKTSSDQFDLTIQLSMANR